MPFKFNFYVLLLIMLCVFCRLPAQENKYPRKIKWGKNTITLDKKPEKIFVGYVSALEILEKLVDEKKIF